MQNDNNVRFRENGRNIIILSEFVEGAWESVRFSIENLLHNHHGLVFVHTYRKPDFGQSLLNNFVPVLKQIIKNELLDLKLKTLKKFGIDESRISIYPFEGDWVSFIHLGQKPLKPDFLVLSMKKAFPGAQSNLFGKARKLASYTTKPLFILPDPVRQVAFERVLYLSGKRLRSLEKINLRGSVPFIIQNATIDFRLVTKTNFNIAELNGDVKRLFDASRLHLDSLGVINTTSESDFLSGQLSHALIIIDQDLLRPSFRSTLNLKKWVENKEGIPVLIC